jgi:hypothetical protein
VAAVAVPRHSTPAIQKVVPKSAGAPEKFGLDNKSTPPLRTLSKVLAKWI